MSVDDYYKRVADPLIRENAKKFVKQVTSNMTGKPFIGQQSDDGYYTFDPGGKGYNLVKLGTPNRVDIAIPVNSNTAVMVGESRPFLTAESGYSDGYMAFQTVDGHNYVRKLVALSTVDRSSTKNPFTDFVGYLIPEILNPGVSPDNYIVLFSADGKHLAFAIAYLDNITTLHPDATGQFFVEWVVIENFELDDDPDLGPVIRGTNFDPVTLTDPRDGSSVKKKYNLSLAFDGFSKGPQQYDPDNPTVDPRRRRIFIYQPGELTPNSGSLLRPLVSGRNASSGDSGEYRVNFSGGGYIERDIGGEESTYKMVFKCHPETKMNLQQVAFAFNSDRDGLPCLDLVAATANTGVYYIFSNDVDQRLWTNQTYGAGTGLNAFGGYAISASYWKCSWHHNQNAIWGVPEDEDDPSVHNRYNFRRDWIGSSDAFSFGQYHVGYLKNPSDWVQPTGPFDPAGQPTAPDPIPEQGIFEGTEYWRVDGYGGSDTSPERSNLLDVYPLPKGSLTVTARGGTDDFGGICEPTITGGEAEDITIYMLFVSQYNHSQFFDGSVVESEDVPFTDAFSSIPVQGSYSNFHIDPVAYNEIRYYPIYPQGFLNVYTFETNICSVQNLNYANQESQSPNSNDAVAGAAHTPLRVIESFPYVGQGDYRVLMRAFRSVEGRSALLYQFHVGTGLDDTTDLARGGISLDDILGNLDALADGTFVPGVSGEVVLKSYKISMSDTDFVEGGESFPGTRPGDTFGFQVGPNQYLSTVQEGDSTGVIMNKLNLVVQQGGPLPDFTTITYDGAGTFTIKAPVDVLVQVFRGELYRTHFNLFDHYYENLVIDQFSRSVYWELIAPYGTQVQPLLPDPYTEPDGHCVSDKWYFPKGSFPYPFENIKATDSQLFLVQVTGQYYGENGELLPQIYDFLYEYEIKKNDLNIDIMVPTGRQVIAPRPTVAGAIIQDYVLRKDINAT